MRAALYCLIAAGLSLHTAVSSAEAFDFALVGDFPYSPREEEMAEHLVDDVRAASVQWVVHVGDIRGREFSDCSDELYRQRAELYRRFDKPFVFTPGDNDWLDCREAPVERLAALRERFFAPAAGFADGALNAVSQSDQPGYTDFVENRRWERAGVVFATVHLLNPPLALLSDKAVDRAYAAVVEAAEAWLKHTFEHARRTQAKGVFVAFQADPWPVTGLPRALNIQAPGAMKAAKALRPFVQRLREEVADFGGPVVVANGDTHYFRVDKPLFDGHLNPYENFTRVEAFGSPFSHWVRVTVDTSRPEVFSFRQEIVEPNVFTVRLPGGEAPPAHEPRRSYRMLAWLGALSRLQPYFAVFGALCAIGLAVLGLRRLWRRR